MADRGRLWRFSQGGIGADRTGANKNQPKPNGFEQKILGGRKTMKKVLSVAMASAMVLGMGANAFAIQYSTGSNDKAEWPSNFQFDGELFVTDKDGKIVKEASTALNDNEAVDFQPGDVIWMPLYADNQLSYDANWGEATNGVEAITAIELADVQYDVAADTVYQVMKDANGVWVYVNGTPVEYKAEDYKNFVLSAFDANGMATLTKKGEVTGVTVPDKLTFDGKTRDVVAKSAKFYINGTQYKTEEAFEAALAKNYYTLNDVKVTVNLKAIKGDSEWVGKPSVDKQNGVRAYGLYTGNIDKNWSINLIEKDGTVSDLIAKAELYKATATDYASYSKYTDEIMPNAVYLKVTLKKEWKTVSNETLKYYVYVANNNNSKKTNQVWVSGKYAPSYRTVDFTWTNNANEASLWKAKENGVAVFDFADKAFFTVKMYKGETMYLDLSTAYDKAIAGDMGVDADSFYKFDNTNANFARAGELVIVTNDDTLVPYEIDEDGNFVELDADYVTNYAIAHTNQKVNGFRFDTKQLGNYVLSTEELGEEAEEPAEEPSEEPAPEVKPENNGKQNPNTGAEDFVGLAVSLAVVSVAAAGALALKK